MTIQYEAIEILEQILDERFEDYVPMICGMLTTMENDGLAEQISAAVWVRSRMREQLQYLIDYGPVVANNFNPISADEEQAIRTMCAEYSRFHEERIALLNATVKDIAAHLRTKIRETSTDHGTHLDEFPLARAKYIKSIEKILQEYGLPLTPRYTPCLGKL